MISHHSLQKKEFVPPMSQQIKPIEDEQHFILECHKYDSDSKGLFEEVEKHCSNFRDLNQRDKFVYLMTVDTQDLSVCKQVAKFISKNMP